MTVSFGNKLAPLLLLAGWMVLLALLPWWLGLILLLGTAAGAVWYARRSASLSDACRLGLKWGLPGCLFALQRALGGDLLAWGAALLGALVGFSLVALLESLLFHRVRRQAKAGATPEWRDMAMAPIGPAAHIIELHVVAWDEAGGKFADPRGGVVRYESQGAGAGRYVFADGSIVDRLSSRHAFSPAGRWFVASLPEGRGDVLCDRHRGKWHRLRGWQLCGWEDGEQPWLARQADGVPVALHEVLGQGDDTGV
ncbi:hypothetical protein SAMN05216570_2243 [Dyella sp. OK004]|uniref:hypothetical protein n=1 Tax=Dyella sp. OK004 TaxID=1855292 RepID=UPI0008F19597|nr:hypothetical protein [Dyella sp. OK004]SFS07260.1 hypothetical protein SAMN05216570_2243 [Dyella sp. OK004]